MTRLDQILAEAALPQNRTMCDDDETGNCPCPWCEAGHYAADMAEMQAEQAAEGAWLRAAEASRFDPIEDQREAMDEGLQWLRARSDEDAREIWG